MPIPSLYELSGVLFHKRFYPMKLSRAKSKVAGKRHGVQPKLGRKIVTIDVNVRRFIRFVTEKIEPIRACTQDSRRPSILSDCRTHRTGIHYALELRFLRPTGETA